MGSQMTKGEYLVGISFNPGGHEKVNGIKRSAADLIDIIDAIPVPQGATVAQEREIGRCKAVAITNVEQAAMWAVKAATKPE